MVITNFVCIVECSSITLPVDTILNIEERGFMYEIVANFRNGIDVDKFDYMARDALNCGVKSNFDFTRLINYSRWVIHRHSPITVSLTIVLYY
jgi:HD superfamily phosphohydrolase